MDFIQLRSYVTVVECGNFSAAAKRLFMAQSTITGHIRQLEEELGCQLITRNTRSMTVTEKGQIFYRYAKQFLGEKKEMETVFGHLDKNSSIRIAATDNINYGLMPNWVTRYYRRNSQTRFKVYQGSERENLSMLRSNAVDIVFTEQMYGDRAYREKDLECIALGGSAYTILAPAAVSYGGDEGQNADPVKLAAKFPFIAHNLGEDDRIRSQNQLTAKFGSRFNSLPTLDTGSVHDIVNYIRIGLGFSVVPNFVAQAVISDSQIRPIIPEGYTSLQIQIYMLYRRGEAEHTVLDFVQFIRNWAARNKDSSDIADYVF